MNNISFRSRADIVKWIACYEGQSRIGRRRYNGNVARDGYLYPIYLVSGYASYSFNLNLIVRAYIFQSTKVGIAVTCDSDIPWLTRERSPFDMSHAMLKSLRCSSF